MLRMGFIDDVEAVLKKTPETRQVALFSATMPSQIKRIAQTYLKNPVEVAIKSQTSTAKNIRQRFWMVSGINKLDALTRILEAEPFEAMIVFARTKLGTDELAEKLAARGFSAAAINGDVDQKMREHTIQRLKDGQVDILVATDVAARGLDVDRISHVLNYDIPYDTESYVHRIGRTGRAGRKGEAILFVAPRERGMLGAIERATRQKIEPMNLPSVDAVNENRVAKFLGKIEGALASTDLSVFRDLVERYEREKNVPAVEIAAALAQLLQGKAPLLLVQPARPERAFEPREARDARPVRDHGPRDQGERPQRDHAERAPREQGAPEVGMRTYRIDVGHQHGVQPGNIVGAIANEADLEARFIGRIDIRDDFTLVDLPDGMPADLLAALADRARCKQATAHARCGSRRHRCTLPKAQLWPAPWRPSRRPAQTRRIRARRLQAAPAALIPAHTLVDSQRIPNGDGSGPPGFASSGDGHASHHVPHPGLPARRRRAVGHA